MAIFSLRTAIALIALPATALAAPPTTGDTAPAATPVAASTRTAAGVPSTPAPAPTADDPPIAPPAADASPAKVEEAKEIAKTAELTPIVPNPGDGTRPAFQLYAEIDPPILAVGTVFALARRIKTDPAFCAPQCDSVKLNSIDKLTAGYYSAGWSTASDYMVYGLGAATAGLLVADEGLLNALNDGVVIGEATLTAAAVASVMTLAAGRPRPLLYGDPSTPSGYKAPLDVRNSADAGLSFLSGHTAQAFAIATSLYITEHRLHPRSRYPYILLGTGLAVASAVGVSRVMAGYHFITDVVGGAVVGASCGVLVSSLHGSPVEVVPIVNRTPGASSTGAAIQGRF
jgi:membrane-associated phospholipid phosphatase